jgi:hypothetical protein
VVFPTCHGPDTNAIFGSANTSATAGAMYRMPEYSHDPRKKSRLFSSYGEEGRAVFPCDREGRLTRLDRYTARYGDFVPVSRFPRVPYSGPRRAERTKASNANQPRAKGISRAKPLAGSNPKRPVKVLPKPQVFDLFQPFDACWHVM